MQIDLTSDELRWLLQIVESGVRSGIQQDGLPAYMVGAGVVTKLARASSEQPSSDSDVGPTSNE